MKILQRLRPRRPLVAVVTAMLGVLSLTGATLGFAGSASATLLGGTPVQYPPGTSDSTIGLLPSGQAATGYADAIKAGQSDVPVASWLFGLADQGTVTLGTISGTWSAGDSINIPIFPGTGATTPIAGAAALRAGTVNDYTAGNYVEFANTPLVACQGGGAGATAPTFTVATATNPNDTAADVSAGLQDVLEITFTNSSGPNTPTPFDCAIVNVNYTTGPNTSTGLIGTYVGTFGTSTDGATYVQGGAPAGTAHSLNQTAADVGALAVASNADVIAVAMSANNPAVSLEPNAINGAISNVVISESTVAQIPAGYICLEMTNNGGNDSGFTTTSTTPTLTVTPSNVGGTASVQGTTFGLEPDEASGSYAELAGQVLTPSTSVPTTFTFSGLTVDAGDGTGPVFINVIVGAAADCSGGTTLTAPGNPDFAYHFGEGLQIFAIGTQHENTRIAGSDADQTAVAALEFEYPPHPGFCVDQGTNPAPNRFDVGSSVVVATDGSWQDALTASYLASYLGTGVLLTPTGSLSTYTAQAIQNEGISNVYIVGGTLAISQAVQNQLAGTTAYLCGGASPQMTALGTPLHLNVQRIAGATADDTAEDVATYVNSGYVNDLNISGDFGLYNDTTGTDSGSAQTVPVRTAILVTDGFFQDAAAASALSYYEDIPILLTNTNSLSTQAETALLDLGIQQVIELGGPLAVSDSVNSSLTSQGIAVLRIAGADGSETSVQLAKFEISQYHGLGWGFGCSSLNTSHNGGTAEVPYRVGCRVDVALARGDYFADALTSSVVTGGGSFNSNTFTPKPILEIENPTTLGQYVTAFLNQAGSPYGVDPQFQTPLTPITASGTSIKDLYVFGGPLAVANSVIQDALNAIAAG